MSGAKKRNPTPAAPAWAKLDTNRFCMQRDGESWYLIPNSGSRHPWLLTNYQGVQQEIGPPGIPEAQHMAEFWLDLETRYPSPRAVAAQ